MCFGAAVFAAAPIAVSAPANLEVAALRAALQDPDLEARQHALNRLLRDPSPTQRRRVVRTMMALLGDSEKAYVRRAVELARLHAASRHATHRTKFIELREQLRTLLEKNPRAMGGVYEELRRYWRPPPKIFDSDPELSRLRSDIVWYSRQARELGQPVTAPAKRLDDLDYQARLASIPHVAPESERAALATVLSLRPELEPGEFEALMLTNEYRVMMGLHALSASRRLTECARQHSNDMRVRNYFGHRSPAPERRGLAERAKLCGYPVRSENIARDCETGTVAFQRWFNSPPHHRNMLDARHRRIGVGQSGTYFTQWFSHIEQLRTD